MSSEQPKESEKKESGEDYRTLLAKQCFSRIPKDKVKYQLIPTSITPNNTFNHVIHSKA